MDLIKQKMNEKLTMPGKVNNVLKHIQGSVGKMLRPRLILLTFDLCGGTDMESMVNVAGGVELVHTASLIHDDIIDRSNLRRGLETIHRAFGTQIAVLLGDHLFAAAFHLFALSRNSKVSELMTEVISQMCTGEINQLLNPLVSEEEYWQYIYQKTACLIGACCRLGAILSDTDDEEGEALQASGDHIGLAFQLTDDLLDYTGAHSITGKIPGQDFAEGIWTLPTIKAYQEGLIPFNWPELEFTHIQSILVHEGIIDYVADIARKQISEALVIFDRYPYSESKNELIHLSKQLLDRTH